MNEADLTRLIDADGDVSLLSSATAQAKNGDLFILGLHRLLCGDSLNEADIGRLMRGRKADFVFLDPPYEFRAHSALIERVKQASQDAHIFTMHSDLGIVDYLRHSAFRFKQFFICTLPLASPRGNDPYLRHILISHEENGAAGKHKNLHDSFLSVLKIQYRHTIRDERIHAHQKATTDVKVFLRHYGGKLALDLFGGSGSTLIAAEEAGISCYMMEMDPVNVDLIVNRWEILTDKEAIKDDGDR